MILLIGSSKKLFAQLQSSNDDLTYFIRKAENSEKKGDYQNAIQLNLKLKNQVEELVNDSTNQASSDELNNYKIIYLQLLFKLGRLHYLIKDYDKSRWYFEKEYEIEKNNYVTSQLYLYLARIHKEKNQLDSSLYFAEKAYFLSKEIGANQTFEQSQVLINSIKEAQQTRQQQANEIALLRTEAEKKDLELANQKELAKIQRRNDSLELVSEQERLKTQQLETEKKASEAKRIQVEAQNAQNEARIAQSEAEKAKVQATQRTQTFLLIGTVILLLLTIAFVIYILQARRKERKASLILEEQKNELSEKTYELEAISEELRQQKDVVEAKNRSLTELQETKDLMISAVNHDLRNPLNPILNYSQKGYPEEDKDRLLYKIHERAGSMLSLINDIMDIYRADKLQIQPKPNNPYQAIEKAILVVIEVKENLPKISNEVDTELLAAFEYKYIQRVFENLLSNAIKYSDSQEQGGKVVFWSHILEENTSQVRLGITDNGIGISEDDLKEIFEPFTNPNARNIGAAKSVGMGLTFCKTIIEAHESTIRVESEEGVGTTFYFDLPLAKAQDTEEKDSEQVIANENFIISNAHKDYLLAFVHKMQDYELFQVGQLTKILTEIDHNDPDILGWKQAIERCVDEYEEEEYQRLLNLIIT